MRNKVPTIFVIARILSQTGVVGTLPTQWSAMENLKTLAISASALEGTLPPQWDAMTALESMFAALQHHISRIILTPLLPVQRPLK